MPFDETERAPLNRASNCRRVSSRFSELNPKLIVFRNRQTPIGLISGLQEFLR
jgi:hypothetical protein